ncbi:hypothetical protein ACFPRL_28795 [Pseudoclavibacter helvolus]
MADSAHPSATSSACPKLYAAACARNCSAVPLAIIAAACSSIARISVRRAATDAGSEGSNPRPGRSASRCCCMPPTLRTTTDIS